MCSLPPQKNNSGEIWFQGKRIDGLPAHKIAPLGITHIPEGRRLFAPMTVLENLEMGAYLRKNKGEIAKQLESIYEHFNILRERRNQKAGSLSGGEQQMLALARALMSQPRLLLMDEPSMGRSPTLVDEVARIIRDINRVGVTIIVVEQNARITLSLADRGYVLEVGEITLYGDAQKLVNDERAKKAYLGG
jgi:branched-chain amino acid transport system ATP-binding protein